MLDKRKYEILPPQRGEFQRPFFQIIIPASGSTEDGIKPIALHTLTAQAGKADYKTEYIIYDFLINIFTSFPILLSQTRHNQRRNENTYKSNHINNPSFPFFISDISLYFTPSPDHSPTHQFRHPEIHPPAAFLPVLWSLLSSSQPAGSRLRRHRKSCGLPEDPPPRRISAR